MTEHPDSLSHLRLRTSDGRSLRSTPLVLTWSSSVEDFMVISGDDGITFPLITLGAVGVISVIGNAFPKEFSKMVRLALNGDYEKALLIHHRFTELFSLLFVDGNPAGVKCLLNAMGFIENELRLPLVPTRITTYEKIRQVLDSLN